MVFRQRRLDTTLILPKNVFMEAEAFDRSLRAFVRRAPFQAFIVELMNGSRFSVQHPEALAFSDGVAVYLSPGGIPSLFDHTSVTQLTRTSNNQSPELA